MPPAKRHPRTILDALLLAVALPLGAGCGATWPEVDSAIWIRSVGAPRVRQVRDLGTRRPPPSGQRLQGESDGVASPGEYLLIEGWGFGKSPAVSVDGRAAEVLARTEGAGIVARVPAGVSPGNRPVEVAVGDSKSQLPFALRRLTAALHGGVLRTFALDGETLTAGGTPLTLRGARSLRIGSTPFSVRVLISSVMTAPARRYLCRNEMRVDLRYPCT